METYPKKKAEIEQAMKVPFEFIKSTEHTEKSKPLNNNKQPVQNGDGIEVKKNNVDTKKHNSDMKRMESMKKKQQDFKEKKLIIKTGLNAVVRILLQHKSFCGNRI